jgi:Mg2+ and Co2+ transporter CorA
MSLNYYVNTFDSVNGWTSHLFTKNELFSLIPDLLERDLYIIDETMNFRISSYSIKKSHILIKLDFIRAIISKNNVHFIKINNKTKSQLLEDRLFKNICNQKNKDNKHISFENKVIECILEFIDHYYTELLDKIIPKSSNIINNDEDGELKLIFDIKKELVSMRFCIKDIYDLLEGMCDYEINDFGEFFTEDTFDQFIEVIRSFVHHFEENIDILNKINDSLDLKLNILDIKSSILRTRMDKMNLLFGIFMISISVCTFITGIFGMNLNSTIQNSIVGFYVAIVFMIFLFCTLFFCIKRCTVDKINN